MSYYLDIITPSGKIFENTVDSLYASGLQGGFEVYSNHQAMLTALKEGDLRVRREGKEIIFKCASGILEVKPDHQVIVLVDSAVQS